MRTLFTILFTGLIAVFVLVGCNSTERKLAATKSAAVPTPPDGIRRITVPELKAMLDADEAVIIDVRNEEAYNVAHIRGAKLIPYGEIINHTSELPKDKLIVTYCS